MKKTILSILIIFSVLIAYGQKSDQKVKKSPEERSEALTQKMIKQLTLTEDQIPKVKEINLDKAKKVEAVRGKYANDKNKTGKGQEIQMIRQDWEVNLKTILTPDQFSKYEVYKKEVVKKRNEKKNNKKSGKGKSKTNGSVADEEVDLYLDEEE